MQDSRTEGVHSNKKNDKQPLLQKVNDDYEVKQFIKDNQDKDEVFCIGIINEIKNFLKFTVQMLFAFPVGLILRKRIRKNKRLNHILQFEELKSIRNNIEKGSFAYDTILFKQNPIQIIQNKSHLANLVCLALLFGDEFIDGIANAYGKVKVQNILSDDKFNYYLQYKKVQNKLELYYAFDIRDVLPNEVLYKVNNKYDINYKDFYAHLQFLLTEMNLHLNTLNEYKALESATLICKVCNKCFDTYKVDIQHFSEDYNWNTLLSYQQSKDDDIIKILLNLRATLLEKNNASYKKHFASWAYMVRSMQVYDDMQDVAADCDFQMNFLAFFAKTFFKNEWAWLQENKEVLKKQDTLKAQQSVALSMPASMMLCMQYNKNITNNNLNWVQQKIQNYLWRKNWINANGSSICNINIDFIAENILSVENEIISIEMKYAHILDTVLLFPHIKENLFSTLSKKERYFLKNFYTTLPNGTKANYAKKIIYNI